MADINGDLAKTLGAAVAAADASIAVSGRLQGFNLLRNANLAGTSGTFGLPDFFLTSGTATPAKVGGGKMPDGRPFIDIRVTGPVGGGGGVIFFEQTGLNGIPLDGPGAKATLACDIQMIAGSLANVTLVQWQFGGYKIDGVFQGTNIGTDFSAGLASNSRPSYTMTADLQTRFVAPGLRITNPTGAIDFTVRLIAPMANYGASSYTFQNTYGARASLLSDATGSSDASVAISASLTKTLGGMTFAGDGSVAISASLTKTLAGLTLSSAGAVGVVGNLSALLGAATTSSAGGVGVVGSVSKTLGALTLVAAAQVPISGALTKTLDAMTFSGSGGVPVVGSLTKTLDPMTLGAAGSLLPFRRTFFSIR